MTNNPGPSELSIADPDAVEAIYGTKSPVTKGSYYAIFEPLVSLQSTRDKADHSRRRKVWDQGFSIKGEYRLSLEYDAGLRQDSIEWIQWSRNKRHRRAPPGHRPRPQEAYQRHRVVQLYDF